MSEPKKLTAEEIASIRMWNDADKQFGIEDLAEIHVAELLGHIDAIMVEHQKWIEELEDYSLLCFATVHTMLNWLGMKSEAGDQLLAELLIRMPESVHRKLVAEEKTEKANGPG